MNLHSFRNIGTTRFGAATTYFVIYFQIKYKTRSSWLNCALRDNEAVFWVSIGHYEAVAVGNWWYWVSRGHSCLYILHKVEIWTGVTDAWLTDWQTTLKDRATQLLIKYKSGALVTQQLCIKFRILQFPCPGMTQVTNLTRMPLLLTLSSSTEVGEGGESTSLASDVTAKWPKLNCHHRQ